MQLFPDNKRVRYAVFTAVILLVLFIGNGWIASLNSPSEIKLNIEQAQQVTESDRNISQAIKPTEASPSILDEQATFNNPILVFAKVTAVIDGDTIEVDLGQGNIKRVRYIGVDTPESVDPRKPIQCFSKEATIKNKELVENNIVGLEKDVSETDRYGRLLRYVYAGDIFVNQELVIQGYASAVSYPPDIKYQGQLRQREQQARSENKGLWGSCSESASNSSSSKSNENSSGATLKDTGVCKYSCTGSDKDCSDFSSHEEAQGFFNCCGFTAENDPMKLDGVGVGDSIACENI